MIRNSAKALVYQDGKLLLNSHLTSMGELYYDLPGGGQAPYETMEEAVVRVLPGPIGERSELDFQQTGSGWDPSVPGLLAP